MTANHPPLQLHGSICWPLSLLCPVGMIYQTTEHKGGEPDIQPGPEDAHYLASAR